jgi:hypothetical protein
MSLTANDIIIITVATILTLITIILVIWEAEKQMYVYGLRPSESTSTDMAGLMTLARGLSGNVENIKYENVTRNVLYDVTIKNKIVCVKSVARYTSSDCSSSAFDVQNKLSITNASGFTFKMDKNDMDITSIVLTKTGGI